MQKKSESFFHTTGYAAHELLDLPKQIEIPGDEEEDDHPLRSDDVGSLLILQHVNDVVRIERVDEAVHLGAIRVRVARDALHHLLVSESRTQEVERLRAPVPARFSHEADGDNFRVLGRQPDLLLRLADHRTPERSDDAVHRKLLAVPAHTTTRSVDATGVDVHSAGAVRDDDLPVPGQDRSTHPEVGLHRPLAEGGQGAPRPCPLLQRVPQRDRAVLLPHTRSKFTKIRSVAFLVFDEDPGRIHGEATAAPQAARHRGLPTLTNPTKVGEVRNHLIARRRPEPLPQARVLSDLQRPVGRHAVVDDPGLDRTPVAERVGENLTIFDDLRVRQYALDPRVQRRQQPRLVREITECFEVSPHGRLTPDGRGRTVVNHPRRQRNHDPRSEPMLFRIQSIDLLHLHFQSCPI